MRKNSLTVFVLVIFTMFSVISCKQATSSNSSVSSSPIVDSKLYISGYIQPLDPVNLTNSTSASYFACFYLKDATTATLDIKDAVITVNGVAIPFVGTSSSGNFYKASSIATLSIGDTIPVVIKQKRVGTLTYNLTIPASAVPSSWTISPNSLVSGTVNTTTSFAITPNSAWTSPYGSVWVDLYDGNKTYQGDYYWASFTGTSTATFSNSNLSYGSTPTLASFLKFFAVAQDKTDLAGFASENGSSSRIRIFAPSGSLIGSNF
jgi:hypothetical protein